jgi:chemotaxis protein MotB
MKTILIVIAVVFAGTAYYFYDGKTTAENALESKVDFISKEKEKEVAQLKGTFNEFAERLKKEIAQGQIKIIQLSDRLSVIMVDKILFPSGEAEITPEGLIVLERIGDVLKNTKNKTIRVEGHTDDVQITKQLKKKYATNWELSTARATNVVRFLQENIGIDATLLQPIGMSEYHPVASNETPDGRSQNRRIEIALLP